MTLDMEPVMLTDTAIDKVRELLEREGDDTLVLRLGARPGGCSGFRYDLSFSRGPAATDTVVETGAFTVVIDETSVTRLMGSTIDFRDDGLNGAGFAIDNPNETGHSCSCGQRG